MIYGSYRPPTVIHTTYGVYMCQTKRVFCVTICYSGLKKVNDIAELNEMKQKRIDKLEKMVAKYENEQRWLIDEGKR